MLAAAALHTGWNLLLKQATSRGPVTWWAVTIGSVLFLPALIPALRFSPSVWALAATSAAIGCVYFVFLLRAYARADFSQAYPMARGMSPLFLAAWSAIAIREWPSVSGGMGLLLISLGLLTIGTATVSVQSSRPVVMAALGVGVCTSLCSLIDGVAVRRSDAPLSYTVLVQFLTALLAAPVIWRRYGAISMFVTWRRDILRVSAAGVLMVCAYSLVLLAYRIAPLAYAGAAREVSVVFGALAGWLWLGEPFGRRRLLGAAVVSAGIFVVATAR